MTTSPLLLLLLTVYLCAAERLPLLLCALALLLPCAWLAVEIVNRKD